MTWRPRRRVFTIFQGVKNWGYTGEDNKPGPADPHVAFLMCGFDTAQRFSERKHGMPSYFWEFMVAQPPTSYVDVPCFPPVSHIHFFDYLFVAFVVSELPLS